MKAEKVDTAVEPAVVVAAAAAAAAAATTTTDDDDDDNYDDEDVLPLSQLMLRQSMYANEIKIIALLERPQLKHRH